MFNLKVDGTSMDWLKQKYTVLDNILFAIIFAIVIGIFLCLSIENLFSGPNSADDAWIALTAKNIAVGNGYATSQTNSKLIPYDPFISTGPSLVIPTAFAVFSIGNLVWIPGAVQLSMFIIQISLVTLLLARRFSWAPALFFMSVLVAQLVFMSLNNWYFGAMLGEPVAFGFILIGIVLLAAYSGLVAIVTAAISFSLAILTKQISIFPVIGIICAWVTINIQDRFGKPNITKQLLFLVSGMLILPITFEVIKLVSLGIGGYGHFIQMTIAASVGHENGMHNFSDRWGVFLDTLFQSYFRPAMAAIIMLMSALCLLPKTNNESLSVKRVALLAWGGIIMQFMYITLISKIWPRYMWIGIAMLLVAISASLLAVTIRTRIMLLTICLALLLVAGAYMPVFELYKQMSSNKIASEREQVIKVLDNNPKVPYAAQYWSSVYDIAYLRENEGEWRYGQSIQELKGNNFFAIINNTHTDKNSNFYRSVDTTCKPIIHSSHYGLFDCSQSFWLSYSD